MSKDRILTSLVEEVISEALTVPKGVDFTPITKKAEEMLGIKLTMTYKGSNRVDAESNLFKGQFGVLNNIIDHAWLKSIGGWISKTELVVPIFLWWNYHDSKTGNRRLFDATYNIQSKTWKIT